MSIIVLNITDGILLLVIIKACGNTHKLNEELIIDNMGIEEYKMACDYLTAKWVFETYDNRIYKLRKNTTILVEEKKNRVIFEATEKE